MKSEKREKKNENRKMKTPVYDGEGWKISPWKKKPQVQLREMDGDRLSEATPKVGGRLVLEVSEDTALARKAQTHMLSFSNDHLIFCNFGPYLAKKRSQILARDPSC